MMIRPVLALATLLFTSLCASAQYNHTGVFHASIGGAFGAHGTEYTGTSKVAVFGVTISQSKTSTGSAATLTVPIELGVGIGKIFSLGLLLEPGSYVDTSASNSKNSLMVGALQPRFYLLNKDRFALMASLQMGMAGLRIRRTETNYTEDARYLGPAYGAGLGMGYNFTEHIGLQFHVRYVATNMTLKAREVNDNSTMDNYEAKLKTSGIIGQLSLAFRFGGH